MAKVIRTATLTNSGDITGEIAQAWSVPPHRRMAFQVSAYGASLIGFLPGFANDNAPQSWNIGITTPGGYDAGDAAPALVSGFGDLGTLDVGGDWLVSVDVDVCLADSPGGPVDAVSGVFHTPPPGGLSIYYMTRVGGSCTVTLNSGGLSLTHTETITDAVVVEDSVGITLSAFTADAEYQIPDAPYYAHDAAGYTAHVTAAHAEGGLTDSGGGVACDNSDGARVVLSAPSTTVSLFGQVHNFAYRPRAFALTSKLNSVGDDYPDPVDYTCSRYLGDPSPGFTAGATASRGGSQARYTADVSGRQECDNTGAGGSSLFGDSADVNEWQAVSLTLDPDWCDAHGEYLDYATTGGTARIRNALIHMQGFIMDGLTLTQDAETVIDDCTSATGWTGMATGGGGLQNSGTTATKTLASNFAGYAYLRINARCASGTATRTLTINGKTWAVPLTATPADTDIDLMNPLTGGADTDTTETKWPLDVAAHDTTNGPLEGLSTVTSLTLSGMDAAHPDTYHGLSLVRKDGTQVSVMEAWAPRVATDEPEYSPPVTNDSDQTTTTYANRGIVALTDGRQSLEEWFHVHDHIETESGLGDSWGQRPQTIANLASVINDIPGWHATINAHADDGTDALLYGYLHRDQPACWLGGAGPLYVGGGSPWKSLIGLDLGDGLTLQARPIFTTLTDWPGGIGDVFEVGPTDGSAVAGTIYLVASKNLRAQSHGALLKVGGGRADGKPVTLTPAAGELQSDTTSVGTATSATDGSYRTTGAGLIGQTGGAGGSSGVVASGARNATQAFKSAWLGWVALRVLSDDLRRWLSADRSATGKAARAHTADDGTLQVDIQADHTGATWTPKTTTITAAHPCLRVDRRSLMQRLWVSYEDGGAVNVAHSDNEAEGFSMAMTVAAGWTYPTFCVTPTNAQHHFGIDSGAIKTRVLDPQGNELVAARTVVASGVADDALAAWHNDDTGDLFLQHRNGSGDIITLRSVDDGLTFA